MDRYVTSTAPTKREYLLEKNRLLVRSEESQQVVETGKVPQTTLTSAVSSVLLQSLAFNRMSLPAPSTLSSMNRSWTVNRGMLLYRMGFSLETMHLCQRTSTTRQCMSSTYGPLLTLFVLELAQLCARTTGKTFLF